MGAGVRWKLDRLEALGATLGRGARIQVGIFSSKSGRQQGDNDNAAIGMVHELGLGRVPARSWLRMPIVFRKGQIMSEAAKGALEHVASGRAAQIWKNLGTACEGAVLDAFATGGFGKWPQLAYATILRKAKGTLSQRRQKAAAQIHEGEAHAAILVETHQLEQATGSRVAAA